MTLLADDFDDSSDIALCDVASDVLSLSECLRLSSLSHARGREFREFKEYRECRANSERCTVPVLESVIVRCVPLRISRCVHLCLVEFVVCHHSADD